MPVFTPSTTYPTNSLEGVYGAEEKLTGQVATTRT